MQTTKRSSGFRLWQALMPRAAADTDSRGVRFEMARSLDSSHFRDQDGGAFSLTERRSTPVRVLVVMADTELRDAYLRILRETDVSQNIAAFRERREQSAQKAPFECTGPTPSARMTSFEALCRHRAESAAALVQEASAHNQPFAIALIDVGASSCDGVRAAIRIREIDPDVEIVLRSGGSVIDPFEIGGLVPPEEKLSYLPGSSTPEQVRQMIIALSSKWLAERRIVRLAYFDSLTGLSNREQFRNRLSSAVESAGHHKQSLAVLYLDLDKFKAVNDRLGHAAGDELLGTVARRLRSNLRYDYSRGVHGEADARPGDLARLGGDEFSALLPDLRTPGDAALVAERLIEAVREPVCLAGTSVTVTPSVGIAVFPRDGANAEALLRNADDAMYSAKRTTPGTYAFFHPVTNAALVTSLPIAEFPRAASA